MKNLISSVFLSGALLLIFNNNSGYTMEPVDEDIAGVKLPEKIVVLDKNLNRIDNKNEKENEATIRLDDDDYNIRQSNFSSRKSSLNIEFDEANVEDDVHKKIAKHIAEAEKLLYNIEEILNRMYERALHGEE